MNGNGKSNGHDEEFTVHAVKWPDPIGEAGYYGIAGEYVNMVAPHTEADPNAILMAFLVYAGNTLGRDFFVPTGADRQCGNLYVSLIGSTAGGRKGSAVSAAEIFFTQGENAPFKQGSAPNIIDGMSPSGEGIIDQVHDEKKKRIFDKKTNRFETMVVEENVEDKRVIYNVSEFQQIISNMRRPDSILSSVLRQAWDKDRLQSPSKNNPSKATGACMSIIAATTREELLLQTSAEDAQNGTLNRFLFPLCQRARLLPEGDSLHELIDNTQWVDLQTRFNKNIRNEIGACLRIKRTVEAQELWGLNWNANRGLYKQLSEPRPGLWGAITARAAQHVIRMSLITAKINGYHEITRVAQDAAEEFWRYCDDSARYIWGDTTDPTAARILKKLREHPEGLFRHEIFLLFNNHRKKEQIDEALTWLVRAGLAYCQIDRETPGRPGETWFATL